MIAGFFVGFFAWSCLHLYSVKKLTAFEETDFSASVAALVIIAGNLAGVGYFVERFFA